MEPDQRLKAKLERMPDAMDVHAHLIPRSPYLGQQIPIGGAVHQAGTTRFGADPATTVLGLERRAHELDDLYVVDASFFPSIGAVNPTLTIIADALRVADHLLGWMGAAR